MPKRVVKPVRDCQSLGRISGAALEEMAKNNSKQGFSFTTNKRMRGVSGGQGRHSSPEVMNANDGEDSMMWLKLDDDRGRLAIGLVDQSCSRCLAGMKPRVVMEVGMPAASWTSAMTTRTCCLDG